MGTKICGYTIVRLPSKILSPNAPRYSIMLSNGESIFYHGLDRLAWEELDEQHYAKELPDDLERIWLLKNLSGEDLTGIEILTDYRYAQKALDYSNERSCADELIVVYSDYLQRVKGMLQSIKRIQWLGYDIFPIGEFSIILAGIFQTPKHFDPFISQLNAFGIFDNEEIAQQYYEHYRFLATKGVCEGFEQPIDYINIGRIVM